MTTHRADPERAIGAFVHGICDDAFERVREAFAANLVVGDDIGATVSVYRHGRCVVDLVGGEATNGQAYSSRTMHLMYSVTKGVVTLCLMKLVEDGLLNLDASVASYWPGFADQGKGGITVRQMLSHQAGLSGFAEPVAYDDCADGVGIAQRLAAQKPYWTPGSGHGYHALTYGFLAGELIRRIAGLSVGDYLQAHFAKPMGLDLYIGLPQALNDRVSPLFDAPVHPDLGQSMAIASADPGTLTYNAFNNPLVDTKTFNDPRIWGFEIPGANGIGTARSLAALYAITVDGPLRAISPAVVDDFRRECVFGTDFVLPGQPTRFGTGFMLSSPREPLLSRYSFGHNGRGGSLAFSDPESGITFAYLGNRCLHEPPPHARLWRLLAAVRDAI